METDWKKGSRAIFGDGKGSGMVSEIEEVIPNQFLSITRACQEISYWLLNFQLENLVGESV